MYAKIWTRCGELFHDQNNNIMNKVIILITILISLNSILHGTTNRKCPFYYQVESAYMNTKIWENISWQKLRTEVVGKVWGKHYSKN